MATQSLVGKVALVTGGSRGLGSATALALAAEGASVALTYLSSFERAASVVRAIEKLGGQARAICADQGDTARSSSLVREVVDELGALDILVNNAGIAVMGKRIDDAAANSEDLDRQWQINANGVVANIRAAATVLREGGRIISIGSGLGTRVAFPGVADYAGSKAAVVGYSRGAARDLGPRNITVNVVQPGIMPTEMAAGAGDAMPPLVREMHALPRIARLEEVAAAVVYLAGPHGAFITGAVLDVNGGFTA